MSKPPHPKPPKGRMPPGKKGGRAAEPEGGQAQGHEPLHAFAQARPQQGALRAQAAVLGRGSPFQPLPEPPGRAPYRLDLARLIPQQVAAMRDKGGMVLHMVGDTGGVRDPNPQTLVAQGLERDAARPGALGAPAFFYHLGDVVYFDGEASQYYPQFYEPYDHYPLPMMGIPGNHDGDLFDNGKRVNPEPSLATFVRNFCAQAPGQHSPDAGDASRTAMIQPNVYWTLLTPFATFVGLYTNVPEGGVVEKPQRDWLVGEMKSAATDQPLIVALHHPPFSFDNDHSGSSAMSALLAEAAQAAGRKPDIVFSGHVHNYQRFSVTDADGWLTPYIVAGHGGYHNLHKLPDVGGQPVITPYSAADAPGVVLERYVDDRFGFLRLEIDASTITLESYTVPRAHESWSRRPRLYDRMRFNWRTRALSD